MRVRASWRTRRNAAVENKEGEGNSSRLNALARARTAVTKNAKFFSVEGFTWLGFIQLSLSIDKGLCHLNVHPKISDRQSGFFS